MIEEEDTVPSFGVSLRKERALLKRMEEMGVSENDLEEKFVRSSGPGGQHSNKVATCVYLCHKPTGVSVKCQKERSQALNRFFARRLLCDEIERERTGSVQAERKRIEKIRRQKRKRSKRAKEKILANKKKQAEKKERRRVTVTEDLDVV